MTSMPNHEPVEPQSLYCGLWRTDDGFVSTIHIKNELIATPLTVIPVIYMSDGTAVNLNPRHVPAGGEMDVNINRAIAKRALAINGHLSSFGNAELLYDWTSPGHIVGSMQILNLAQSLIFTDSFEPPKITEPIGAINHPVIIPPTGMHHIEMLWWKHDPGVQVFAGFTNTSVRPLVMNYTLKDAAGTAGKEHELMLGPHATQFLDLTTAIDLLPPGANTAGGISIQYDGDIGQLLAVGQMENPDIGYSDHMPYAIHDLTGKIAIPLRIACTGLMTGQPDPVLGFPSHIFFTPYLVIRNASLNPLPIRLTLSWMRGSTPKTFQIPQLNLPAGASGQIPMTDWLRQAGLSTFGGTINLEIAYTGHRGDLLVAAGSVDYSGSYVFATLPELVLPSFGKHESYWATGSGYDTMITLWNTGNQPEDLLMRFYYADGSGKYTMPVHLDPMGSQTIDMNQLIASGVNDWKNRAFSMLKSTGSLSFENLDGHTKAMTVNIDVAVYNPFTATCGCYCTSCCNYNDFGMTPIEPPAIIMLTNDSFLVTGYACYCNGSQEDLYGTVSIDPNTPTVSVNGSTITVNGPGGATYYFTFSQVIVGGATCYGAYQGGCSYAQPMTQGTVDGISIQITNVDLVNDAINVNLQGNSSISGTLSLTWNGSNGSVNITSINEAPGSYSFQPSLSSNNLPADQYTGVTAEWLSYSNIYNINFDVLGTNYHTQYNVPTEASCTGSSGIASWDNVPSACSYSPMQFLDEFITQAWENGSGISINHGPIQLPWGCPTPFPNDSFKPVSSITGSCGTPLTNSTVAVDQSSPNHPLSCGDQILIVGYGPGIGTVKTVADSCAACINAEHIDDFTTSPACNVNQINTLGYYQTIRINR